MILSSIISRPKRTGIIAINIDEDDELIGARLTTEGDDVVLATSSGMAIRFSVNDVRPMGRVARGVRGVSLSGDDHAVSLVKQNRFS